jgi:hypothetical protein
MRAGALREEESKEAVTRSREMRLRGVKWRRRMSMMSITII